MKVAVGRLLGVACGVIAMFLAAAVPAFAVTLTVDGSGSGSGSVASVQTGQGGHQIACDWDGSVTSGVCSEAFPIASTVELTATEDAGPPPSTFTGWSTTAPGTCETEPASKSCTVKLGLAPATITAGFAIATAPPEVRIDPVEHQPTAPCTAGVSATEACFSGEVNPRETDAKWHFKYRQVGAASWTNAPATEGDAGSGNSFVPVDVTVAGLEPNSEYEVKLTATNSAATGAESPAETFSTDAVPPVVTTSVAWVRVPAITTVVSLSGTVNPRNSAMISCRFQLVPLSQYEADGFASASPSQEAPCASLPPAGGVSKEVVAEVQSGLLPSTAYRYRLVAANSVGPTGGEARSFVTFPNAPDEADCPNAVLRVGWSSALHECRAYELVSTGDKHGNDAMSPNVNFTDFGMVAASGEHVEWDDRGATPNPAPTNGLRNSYLSERTPTGWSTPVGLTPPGASGSTEVIAAGASSELEAFALATSPYEPETGERGAGSLLYRQPTGAFTTITTGYYAPVVHLSADGSRVYFGSEAHVLPQDTSEPGSFQLYEYTLDSGVRLAGVNTEGDPLSPCGALLAGAIGRNDEGEGFRPDVSATGARVIFQSPDPTMEHPPASCAFGGPAGASYVSDLYLREGEKTIDISKPPAGIPDYGASFVGMTPSGSEVFFITETALPDEDPSTPEKSTEGHGHADLYRYETATGYLTRLSVAEPGGEEDAGLTPLKGKPSAAAVASADGSTVYFTADGQLVSGEGKTRSENGVATADLYRWHEGSGISFIATVASGSPRLGKRDEEKGSPLQTDAVTPTGSDLLFTTKSRLTAYDNEGANEFYRYDAATGQIDCVSCAPDDASPNGSSSPIFGSTFEPKNVSALQIGGLSEDGSTVVFASRDSLLPEAVNDATPEGVVFDVYAWHDGKLSLISTGASESQDLLLGTSQSGNDVFFLTQEQLAPEDSDYAYDIYDARVDGGFPQPVVPPPACQDDGCRSNPTAPTAQGVLGTTLLEGPGNLAPAPVLTAKSPTRRQKLARALKACKKRARRKRAACKAAARKRYKAKSHTKHKARKSRRAHRRHHRNRSRTTKATRGHDRARSRKAQRDTGGGR